MRVKMVRYCGQASAIHAYINSFGARYKTATSVFALTEYIVKFFWAFAGLLWTKTQIALACSSTLHQAIKE